MRRIAFFRHLTHIGLVALFVVAVGAIGLNVFGTQATFLGDVLGSNTTLSTKDYTAPLSALTTTETSPTTNTSWTIDVAANEDPSLAGQSGINGVDILYAYRPYTSPTFTAPTILSVATAPGNCPTTPPILPLKPQTWNTTVPVDVTTLHGDGVYQFFSQAVDCEGNIEDLGVVADITIEVDTTPPPMPTWVSPADGAVVQPSALIMDWTDELDVDSAHPPVTYDLQRADDAAFTINVVDANGLTASDSGSTQLGLPNGQYFFRVQACDALGNCSGYSVTRTVTVNDTPPISTLTLTQPTIKDIENTVVNGGFESGLSGWTTVGNVQAVTTDVLGGGPDDRFKSRSNLTAHV
jgi:hypothetical protein